ncbi:class I SAM-dependent DNA methyltransferase [Larkinella punicea]|uniref:site-specific DNA-methyltransferase (adenine-specific) n=1 Tax=Larkinella punicea TaxID=2315727 RepID=A0A368JFD6_9BACT|nr:N-6 DNA methylase [Larkinella punicea]RCR66378.1 SAM-dependent methyltransferase [Larkinella punicea]
MNPISNDIIARLWNLCNVLKDDGVTYHQYVTELTYLLFFKMAKETGTEGQIPKGHRWDNLIAKPKLERLEAYKITLIHLGTHGEQIVKEIFSNASSFIKKPATLSALVEGIDKLAWYNAGREDLGDIYEGLLEKSANEKKSGAGQYFTTRSLIDSLVTVMKPTLDDLIQDPAAGTGGFLIAANHYIREHQNPENWNKNQLEKYRTRTFFGMEHVQDTHRLALMNLFLHGIDFNPDAGGVHYGDTLSPDGQKLPGATLILSNPPFGSKKGGGLPERTDLPYPTSNKQFCFLQHIYRGLKPGGRAAVVLPDNALFEGNIGKQIRADLMDKCNLHTILRLPTGIFYAQGVKTCVIFFTKGHTDQGNTKEVWVYDLRANMPQYGKRTLLTRNHFSEFETAFGDDPLGRPEALSRRRDDTGITNRFRRFSREWIAQHNDNLDISWLKDESEELPEPGVLAREVMEELEGALEELREIMEELGEEVEV